MFNLKLYKMETKLLNAVNAQEQVLLNLRNSLQSRRITLSDNKTWNFERAKFIGMLDILDALEIDRSEFSWIF